MSHINYGSLMYSVAKRSSLNKIAVVHKKAIRATFLAKFNLHVNPILIIITFFHRPYKAEKCKNLKNKNNTIPIHYLYLKIIEFLYKISITFVLVTDS